MPRKDDIPQDLLAVLVEHSPNIVFAANQDGTLIFSNQAARKAFEMEGFRNVVDILGIPQAELIAKFTSSLQTHSFVRQVADRHFKLILSRLPGQDVWVCYGSDITDMLKAQIDLHANEQFLRRVIDTDPNLIFVKDIEGRFMLVNQAVADIYGSTIDGLVGKKDSDFNDNPEEVEHFRRDDLDVILGQHEKSIVEEQVTNFQGVARWFSTVKRPIKLGTESKVHVLGVSTDITEVRKLQEQLGQAQKMQALGQLAGGIAHDFNNLLTAILGHAEVLQVMRPHDPEVMKSAKLIFNAGGRAQQLTGQLLGFARQGKNQHTQVDLKAVIEETLVLLKRTMDPSITLTAQHNNLPVCILGDPTQIQQVLMNLVLNARDAILTRDTSLGRGNILFETSWEDGKVVLTVSDDGCGMPEDIQKRMFEPFFTTKGQGKGTGLGLAMVYGIVQNHNGEISVESIPGKGTSFSIKLPGSTIVSAPEPSPIQLEFGSRQNVGRILVVDDNLDVQDAAEVMLESLGYTVSICSSGEEGLALLAQDANYDLVLVDLMMPGIGGAETVKAIRKSYQIPIIVTTGYGENHAIQQLLDSGVLFIKKPYELRELQGMLNQALKT